MGAGDTPVVLWVRLRWWEGAALVLPLGIALLFLAGGLFTPGVVLLAVIAAVVATRARPVEREVAGSFANARGTLLWLKGVALLAIYIVIVVIVWRARGDDWNETTEGSTALWALGGLSFFLLREVLRLGRQAENHWRGGAEERAVGELLDTLRDEGFVVSHNLPRESRGNVDHLVVTPRRRAFVVETKTGRSNAAARAQAVSNAIWAKDKFGGYTTAILCVGTDPPAAPVKNAHAWVLGRDDLLAFLRNPPPIDAGVWRPPPA